MMRAFGLFSIALALTVLLAARAFGQSASASATVSGQVGEAVFVSIAPGAQLSGETHAVTHGNLNQHSVRLSIRASGVGRRISIPLQLRSNAGYTLSASTNSDGATPLLLLRELCVESVRATGRHVASGALDAADVATCEGATAGARTRNAERSAPRVSSPATLLRGPLISLSGTADSPSNALEVLLRLEVGTQSDQTQGSIELILSATPTPTRPR